MTSLALLQDVQRISVLTCYWVRLDP